MGRVTQRERRRVEIEREKVRKLKEERELKGRRGSFGVRENPGRKILRREHGEMGVHPGKLDSSVALRTGWAH